MSRYAVSALIVLLGAASPGWAQTTTSPGIDVEVYNAADASNKFCVSPGEILTAFVVVRPGTSSTTCTPACGTTVPGGSSAIATGVIDLAFDSDILGVSEAVANPNTVAAHGLIQDNSSSGRIGWALAGNWSVPGDLGSDLLNPCEMDFFSTTGWVYRIRFQVAPGATGTTILHLRRPTDSFALSFADICNSPTFSIASGDIDEVVDGTVLVAASCTDVLFFDSFESGSGDAWTVTVP